MKLRKSLTARESYAHHNTFDSQICSKPFQDYIDERRILHALSSAVIIILQAPEKGVEDEVDWIHGIHRRVDIPPEKRQAFPATRRERNRPLVSAWSSCDTSTH